MTMRLLILGVLVVATTTPAIAQQACRYNHAAATCGSKGCIAIIPADTPDDYEPEDGDRGVCGTCTNDLQCDGRTCRDGMCLPNAHPVPRPESIWPSSSLATVSVGVNLADATDSAPIVAPGYYFQGAFREVDSRRLLNGTWGYTDLPTWYFHVGAELAFAGQRQHTLFDAGLTYYTPGVFVNTWGLSALFEGQGTKLWKVTNPEKNLWRAGPALRVGFLYSVYLRAGYVFHMWGRAHESGAWLITLQYMRNLTKDLIPDRYRGMLPDVVPP